MLSHINTGNPNITPVPLSFLQQRYKWRGSTCMLQVASAKLTTKPGRKRIQSRLQAAIQTEQVLQFEYYPRPLFCRSNAAPTRLA